MELKLCILTLLCGIFSTYGQRSISRESFPEDFKFGVATAAYKIEGGWDADGKGENIWDRYTHTKPEAIKDGSNGDIACDSYHKYEEDVKLMKDMGVQFYSFSISWSRILPTGFSYQINAKGVEYYNNLINLLLENKIEPMVTLFHWDTPQPLEDIGGFANELMVDWFEQYARIAFREFGNRVKLWMTFNEPKQVCLQGYGKNTKDPGYSGIGDYMCGHTIIKAHARAYHVYNDEFRIAQKGKVGIALDTFWYEPASTSEADQAAAERMMDFTFGWFASLIFNGNYPGSMENRVGHRSLLEGFTESRLPTINADEQKYIMGTADYLGINHFTTQMVMDKKEDPIGDPSYESDCNVHVYYDEGWPNSSSPWLKVVPWGFDKVLGHTRRTLYGPPDIYITGNGYSDHGQLDDTGRIDYYKQYLSAVLDAIHYGKINVKGYAAWSLLDNFEWKDGYTNRFGLHHVDFEKPDRPRTPKDSAKYFKSIISMRRLPPEDWKDNGVKQSEYATIPSLLMVAFSVVWSNRR